MIIYVYRAFITQIIYLSTFKSLYGISLSLRVTVYLRLEGNKHDCATLLQFKDSAYELFKLHDLLLVKIIVFFFALEDIMQVTIDLHCVSEGYNAVLWL